jgi:hypothetical protein
MYKKILCVGVLALGLNGAALAEDFGGSDYDADTSTSISEESGIYLGGQLGMSNMHYGSKYTVSGNTVENSKFAGRAYFGYAFSQFISAELGYDYYGYPNFKAADGNTQDFLQQGVDLVAKATLPLDYGFGFYIKGGLAWVHRGALNSNTGFASKEANGTITPVGALGVNYWFAPNIALDLSWTKTMTVSDLPTIDFIALGIIYRINI